MYRAMRALRGARAPLHRASATAPCRTTTGQFGQFHRRWNTGKTNDSTPTRTEENHISEQNSSTNLGNNGKTFGGPTSDTAQISKEDLVAQTWAESVAAGALTGLKSSTSASQTTDKHLDPEFWRDLSKRMDYSSGTPRIAKDDLVARAQANAATRATSSTQHPSTTASEVTKEDLAQAWVDLAASGPPQTSTTAPQVSKEELLAQAWAELQGYSIDSPETAKSRPEKLASEKATSGKSGSESSTSSQKSDQSKSDQSKSDQSKSGSKKEKHDPWKRPGDDEYVNDPKSRDYYGSEVLPEDSIEKFVKEGRPANAVSIEDTVGPDKRGFEWEENPGYEVKDYFKTHIKTFQDLPQPHEKFGEHQHMVVDPEFKEVLKSVLNCFPTIRYAFAYGSGVFPQSKRTGKVPTDAELKAIHPNAPAAVRRTQDGSPKMIDFIFGVPLTSHWHSLNMKRHRDHYSGLAMLGPEVVSHVQDRWGAGVYYNPYVIVNGILIKYGVVNIDTLTKDLYEWNSLYLAGRLHKPVKILRDHPQMRLANQVNILAALRVALLLLPEEFTERELYATIAGLSYLGDPRMALPTENPQKIDNIVGNNIPSFRRLYSPLIDNIPNVHWDRPKSDKEDWYMELGLNLKMRQDLDPVRRGNMVRRLPKTFRSRLYFQYQRKFAIPRGEFNRMMDGHKTEDSDGFKRQEGGGFEQRIAQEDIEELRKFVRMSIKQTISWPSTVQSLKGVLTAGIPRSWRYMGEKVDKWKQGTGRSKT